MEIIFVYIDVVWLKESCKGVQLCILVPFETLQEHREGLRLEVCECDREEKIGKQSVCVVF